MLQIIFGDDEHTASDGPYSRVLKTRKWMYISSLALLLVSLGLYDQQAVKDTLKIVQLPTNVLSHSLVFAVIYLFLEYTLLIVQLVTTYDIITSERFTFRRSDELTSARDRVSEANRTLQTAILTFRSDFQVAYEAREGELKEQISERTKSLASAEKARIAAELRKDSAEEQSNYRYAELRQKTLKAKAAGQLKMLREDALKNLDPSYDPDVRLAQEAHAEAGRALASLMRQVPSERNGYKSSEFVIDAVRVIPPIILALLSITQFFFGWPIGKVM